MQPGDAYQISTRTILAGMGVSLNADEISVEYFQPHRLRDKGVLRDEEITGNVLNAAGAVFVPTAAFELSILPTRMRLELHPRHQSPRDDVLRVLGGIVSFQPQPAYTAVDFNFDFLIAPPEDSDFYEWTRTAFMAPALTSLIDETDERHDARFGAYFSTNDNGMRLKMDLKPVRMDTSSIEDDEEALEGEEHMRVSVDFHAEIDENRDPRSIESFLEKWDGASSRARRLVRLLEV